MPSSRGHADQTSQDVAILDAGGRIGIPDRLPWMEERLAGWSAWFAVGVLFTISGFSLAYASSFGRYVRPISDDWCQAGRVRRLGIGGLVTNYWHLNGRIGNAVIAAAVQSAPHGREVLPGILLFGGTAALYFLTREILSVLRLGSRRFVVAAACMGWIAACVVRDGSRSEGDLLYQSLFWAPGSITHTVPALALATVGAIALMLARSRWFVVAVPALFVVATLIGTTTELFTVLLGAVLIMILLARRIDRCRANRVDVVLATGAAAMVTAALVLLLSPGLRSRAHASPFSGVVLRSALRTEPHLLQHALLEPWLLAPVACGLLLGGFGVRLAPRAAGQVHALGWGILACVVTIFGGSLLTALAEATLDPLVGHGALAYPRSWADFMLATGLAVFGSAACVGYLVARTLAQRWSGPHTGGVSAWVVISAVLATAVTGLVIYQGAMTLHAAASAYQARARSWDAENSRIISEVRSGADAISYTDLPFARLAEPFTAKGRPTFAADCLADYYGVSTVQASSAATAAAAGQR